jgi:hypothetical protein
VLVGVLVGVAVALGATEAVGVLLGVCVLLVVIVTRGFSVLLGSDVILEVIIVLSGKVANGFISGLFFAWLQPLITRTRNNPSKKVVNAFKACDRRVFISIL